MIEDEMVAWHYRLNGHQFEQSQGVGDGQGGLACCIPWGRNESDMTEQLTYCCILLVFACPRNSLSPILNYNLAR